MKNYQTITPYAHHSYLFVVQEDAPPYGDSLNPVFFEEIKTLLKSARQRAYAAVNFIMVETYWKIGERIVQEEQQGEGRARYGAFLIKELSKKLNAEFGKGFSVANLKNFRQFYLTYPNFEKGYTLRSELTWSHYRLIMRVKNENARKYYMHEAADQMWSIRQLERNIYSHYFERHIKLQAPKSSTKEDHFNQRNFIKDPYVLEFLNIPEHKQDQEIGLESALIDNLQQFMLELGKGFAFVGRQFRISTESSHFYIDLVFYNYLLKCFVLVDLKSGKLTHQDIGQMDMYVRMFDDLKRLPTDSPTIGLVLCKKKDTAVAKYSVLQGNEQLFAAKYQTILPTEAELAAELERNQHLLKQREEEE